MTNKINGKNTDPQPNHGNDTHGHNGNRNNADPQSNHGNDTHGHNDNGNHTGWDRKPRVSHSLAR